MRENLPRTSGEGETSHHQSIIPPIAVALCFRKNDDIAVSLAKTIRFLSLHYPGRAVGQF
jgi:hypothetical protein